jgi:hypothetical protein
LCSYGDHACTVTLVPLHCNRKLQNPHVLAPYDDGSVAMACQYAQVRCTSVIDDDAKLVDNKHYTPNNTISLLSNQVTAKSAVARLCQTVRGGPRYTDLPPVSCLGLLALPFGHLLSNHPPDVKLKELPPFKKATQDYDEVLFSLTLNRFHVCRMPWCSRSSACLVSHRVSRLQ